MKFENQNQLIDSLKNSLGESHESKKVAVEAYATYCYRLKNEKNKDKTVKNPWMAYQTVENLDAMFRRVMETGLDFDGVHVTIQARGITYDYQAYKKRMYLAYPESLVDLQLVYKGDTTSFKKESGEVIYSHHIKDPFNQEDNDILGGYCVIKNKRGEFLTTLSKKALDKHRDVAKTTKIWDSWLPEMCLKTLIRKGVKFHFDDDFDEMNQDDNKNYDLDLSETQEARQKLSEIIQLCQDEEFKTLAVDALLEAEAKSGIASLKFYNDWINKFEKNV